MSEIVVIVPYHSAWAEKFAAESSQVLAALGDNARQIHHIGSTAISSIVAKPIVDMLAVVDVIEQVDDRNGEMESLGYEPMGEYGIEGRRYFRKNDAAGIRVFHLHVFGSGSSHIDRHLAFRDFLNSNPEWAAAYSELKLELTTGRALTMVEYHDGKSDFVSRVEQLALAWWKERHQ